MSLWWGRADAESKLMLGQQDRTWLHTEPTDMRKFYYDLSALVKNQLEQDSLSGHYLVFVNRHKAMMKVLYFELLDAACGVSACSKDSSKCASHRPDNARTGYPLSSLCVACRNNDCHGCCSASRNTQRASRPRLVTTKQGLAPPALCSALTMTPRSCGQERAR